MDGDGGGGGFQKIYLICVLHWIGWVLMFVPVTQDKDTESESVLMEKKQKARKYSENLPHHLNQKVWQWNCWMTKSKRKFERRHAQWALPLDPTNGDSWFNKTENPPKEALDKTEIRQNVHFFPRNKIMQSFQWCTILIGVTRPIGLTRLWNCFDCSVLFFHWFAICGKYVGITWWYGRLFKTWSMCQRFYAMTSSHHNGEIV